MYIGHSEWGELPQQLTYVLIWPGFVWQLNLTSVTLTQISKITNHGQPEENAITMVICTCSSCWCCRLSKLHPLPPWQRIQRGTSFYGRWTTLDNAPSDKETNAAMHLSLSWRTWVTAMCFKKTVNPCQLYNRKISCQGKVASTQHLRAQFSTWHLHFAIPLCNADFFDCLAEHWLEQVTVKICFHAKSNLVASGSP